MFPSGSFADALGDGKSLEENAGLNGPQCILHLIGPRFLVSTEAVYVEGPPFALQHPESCGIASL